MKEWFDTKNFEDISIELLNSMAQANAECSTMKELNEFLVKSKAELFMLFFDERNKQPYTEIVNSPNVLMHDLEEFLTNAKKAGVADRVQKIQEYDRLYRTFKLDQDQKMSDETAESKSFEMQSKQDDKLIFDFENNRDIFALKVLVSRKMFEEVEQFLLSDEILHEVYKDVQNLKPVEKCAAYLKNVSLKKGFKYSDEVEELTSQLRERIAIQNLTEMYHIFADVRDPLNSPNEFDHIFKHLFQCAALNEFLNEEGIQTNRKDIIKFCVTNRQARALVDDCINDGTTNSYIGFSATDKFKEFFTYAYDMIQNPCQSENLLKRSEIDSQLSSSTKSILIDVHSYVQNFDESLHKKIQLQNTKRV